MPNISKRKLTDILKSGLKKGHKNIPEPDGKLIQNLYASIPDDFEPAKRSQKLAVKLGFAFIVTAVIIYSVVSIFTKKNPVEYKNNFKPTKVVVLNYPSFKPTKVVEITPSDQIRKGLK